MMTEKKVKVKNVLYNGLTCECRGKWIDTVEGPLAIVILDDGRVVGTALSNLEVMP